MPSSSARSDETVEASLGNAGAAIIRNASSDIAISAAHQHVRHRLTQRAPPRDRVQMRLTLGLGQVDEISFSEPYCLFQHRPGDRDIVVVGETPQHFDWRVAHGCETVRELGASLVLDLLDQQPKYLVEDIDVLVVVVAGAVNKESCDTLQASRSVFDGSRAERPLQAQELMR